MFKIEIDGLNELQNMLENMQNQIDNLEGTLSINADLIMQNINSFNQSFNTTFSENISNDELQAYFNKQYLDIYEKHFTDNVDYKNEFNTKFNGYAHID